MANTAQQFVIESHLHAIIKALGFDRSELATERFAYLLETAALDAMMAIDDSHKEGLGLNAVPVIAESLILEA